MKLLSRKNLHRYDNADGTDTEVTSGANALIEYGEIYQDDELVDVYVSFPNLFETLVLIVLAGNMGLLIYAVLQCL